TTISGNVTVQSGANLNIAASQGSVVIRGHVTGQKGCDFVEVDHSGPGTTIVIGGDLTIDGCTGGFNGCRALTTATLPDNTAIGGSFKCNNSGGGNECVTDRCVIAGNLDCSGNSGGCVVPETTVGGNVTLNNNAGAGASVTSGAVGGNVTITNNTSGAVT